VVDPIVHDGEESSFCWCLRDVVRSGVKIAGLDGRRRAFFHRLSILAPAGEVLHC